MSPPCQPFTRGGKFLDDQDPRSSALVHLIKVLKDMKNAPQFVLLENVLNFERSVCRKLLVETLAAKGYKIEEYLVSPIQPPINIPNNRLRYYLIAKKISDKPIEFIDRIFHSFHCEEPNDLKIEPYLDSILCEDNEFVVPEKFIKSCPNFRYDIVTPQSQYCSTFTKAYGSKHVIGVGSFLQQRNFSNSLDVSNHQQLIDCRVRFFTPNEVARLQGFPAELTFPDSLSTIQRYKLLGNSLNVKVVSWLINRLINDF